MRLILKKIEQLQSWILIGLSVLSTFILFVFCIQILFSFFTFVRTLDVNKLSIEAIFNLLSALLTALILLELIENISSYLKDHVLNVEVAVTTALIAVSRKIILFEFEKESYQKLLALGVSVISLSLGYYLLHKAHSDKHKAFLGMDSLPKAMSKRRLSDR
jgi:uncharacterized membrane protein (DUF373 family)